MTVPTISGDTAGRSRLVWGTLQWGALAGLVAGLIVAFGSFWQLIVVAIFTAIGIGVGWVLRNRADLTAFLASRRR